MININLKHGARSVGERELRQRHYKNLVDLVDLVLDGRKTYLESIKGTDKYDVLHQQYESQRTNLIQNFGNMHIIYIQHLLLSLTLIRIYF